MSPQESPEPELLSCLTPESLTYRWCQIISGSLMVSIGMALIDFMFSNAQPIRSGVIRRRDLLENVCPSVGLLCGLIYVQIRFSVAVSCCLQIKM